MKSLFNFVFVGLIVFTSHCLSCVQPSITLLRSWFGNTRLPQESTSSSIWRPGLPSKFPFPSFPFGSFSVISIMGREAQRHHCVSKCVQKLGRGNGNAFSNDIVYATTTNPKTPNSGQAKEKKDLSGSTTII